MNNSKSWREEITARQSIRKERMVSYSEMVRLDKREKKKIRNTPILILPSSSPSSAFPQNSFSEWADYRFYGLRSAMAYVFVFDLTCYESFTHIKALRDQVMQPLIPPPPFIIIISSSISIIISTFRSSNSVVVLIFSYVHHHHYHHHHYHHHHYQLFLYNEF